MEKTIISNAPLQLRKEMHIGSFIDIIILDLIHKYSPDTNIMVQWNALGKFREKDGTDKLEAFLALLTTMENLIDEQCSAKISHLVDSGQEIKEQVLQVISDLIEEKKIRLREYRSWYCENCGSYLGPISNPIKNCKHCAGNITAINAVDLFMATDKNIARELANELDFVPNKMKLKFLGVFNEMPDEFIITKKRTLGISVANIDPSLNDRVLDPKFVYSLFPTLADRLGLAPISHLVLGEDILGRYLYYLISNNRPSLLKNSKLIIHGLLTQSGKKISKYGNFPEVADIRKFLEKYSWEHLKLLSVSANIGQNIDFNQKIGEISKILTKKKNVLFFLEKSKSFNFSDEKNLSKTETEIIKYCQELENKLGNFEFFDFYNGYRQLWFDFLSRDYIAELKIGNGSLKGLEKIIMSTAQLF